MDATSPVFIFYALVIVCYVVQRYVIPFVGRVREYLRPSHRRPLLPSDHPTVRARTHEYTWAGEDTRRVLSNPYGGWERESGMPVGWGELAGSEDGGDEIRIRKANGS